MNPSFLCCFPVRPALFGAVLAINLAVPGLSQEARTPTDQTRVDIQVTEVGCLRAMLVLDRAALGAEKLVAQRLAEVDFRLFPSARTAGARFTPADARALGEGERADLVIHATAGARERTALADFKLFEGEATVQVWNALSGELIATHTARAMGPRTTDRMQAQRSAVEKAIDAATHAAVQQSLAKAHKILAHEAAIVNVFSEGALLAIMEYVGKMEGVYHVRRVSFDRQANEALIEIIGAPQTQTFWRAYLEKMPKTQVNFRLNPNDQLRSKYPSWFLPPASN